MNIVVVSDFAYVNGGNASVALSSAIRLAQQGDAVTLFAGAGPVDPRIGSSAITVVCTDQQAIGEDPKRTRAITQGIWNIKAARMMAQVLQSVDLGRTIIHVHGWDKVLSSSVIRTALAMGAKVVCTLHDYVSVCPNGGFYNHPHDEICPLRPMSFSCIREGCDRRGYTHKLWRVARQVVQKQWGLVPDGIRHVIVVSEFSRRILNPCLSPATRIHHVPNMISVPRGVATSPHERTAYVMVGRMSREKGPHLLARVAARTDWDVRFVGGGESLADIKRMAPRATVTGWVPHDQAMKELAGARALVFPFLWYETEGLVVLEAAALGIPAIVADSCAARDLVSDGDTGLYFRSGDEQSLQAAMARLQDDRLVRRLGAAAYDRYWKHPRSMTNHIRALKRVYELVLNES